MIEADAFRSAWVNFAPLVGVIFLVSATRLE